MSFKVLGFLPRAPIRDTENNLESGIHISQDDVLGVYGYDESKDDSTAKRRHDSWTARPCHGFRNVHGQERTFRNFFQITQSSNSECNDVMMPGLLGMTDVLDRSQAAAVPVILYILSTQKMV